MGARATNDVLDIKAGYDGDLIKETTVHQLLDRFLDILESLLKRSLHGTLQDVLKRNNGGDGGKITERQTSH